MSDLSESLSVQAAYADQVEEPTHRGERIARMQDEAAGRTRNAKHHIKLLSETGAGFSEQEACELIACISAQINRSNFAHTDAGLGAFEYLTSAHFVLENAAWKGCEE